MEDDESGYSENSYDRGRSYRGDSYDDGRSYARGRGRNTRRDSMGRYSRNYSRHDSKQEYIESLRDMMEYSPDESTRQSIMKMIQQLEQN